MFVHLRPSYKIQAEWEAINPFFKQSDLLLTIKMVRFLSVASLVLFLQIALVSADDTDRKKHGTGRTRTSTSCASGTGE